VDRDGAAQVRREPGQEVDVLGAELALRRRAEHADVRQRAVLAAGGAQVDQGTQALGPQAIVVEGGAQELGLRHQAPVDRHAADRERRRARRQLVPPRVALEVAGDAGGVGPDLHDPAGAARPDDAEDGDGAPEQPGEVGQDVAPVAEARGRVVQAVGKGDELLTVGRHGRHPHGLGAAVPHARVPYARRRRRFSVTLQ
jgi:hypothetical protein